MRMMKQLELLLAMSLLLLLLGCPEFVDAFSPVDIATTTTTITRHGTWKGWKR